jgi:hypothetical protein
MKLQWCGKMGTGLGVLHWEANFDIFGWSYIGYTAE